MIVTILATTKDLTNAITVSQMSIAKLSLQYSCSTRYTNFNAKGKGEGTVIYLDRQNVLCYNNE